MKHRQLKTAGLLLLSLGLWGCERQDTGAARQAPGFKTPVKVGVVTEQTFSSTLAAVGTLVPRDRATVAAQVAGQAAEAEFAVGQEVRAGQRVLSIRAAEYRARLEQARASLAQIRRELEREVNLHAKGVSAVESVRAFEDRERIAAAAVAEAEVLLGYTEARAPFAGVITRKFVNTGDVVAPGTPLFAVEAPWPLRAEVEVPASLPALSLGARIDLDSSDHRTVGTLVEFSTAADERSRTRLAKIDVPNDPAFRSGAFVRAYWPAGDAQRLVMPLEARGLFGQIERVFVVEGGIARLRLVKTGARRGDGVEILAGLASGETVVLNPPRVLRDGDRVEVAP